MFISFQFTTTIIFSKAAFNTIHNYFIRGCVGHLIKPAKIRPLVIPQMSLHLFLIKMALLKCLKFINTNNKLSEITTFGKLAGQGDPLPQTSGRANCGVSQWCPATCWLCLHITAYWCPSQWCGHPLWPLSQFITPERERRGRSRIPGLLISPIIHFLGHMFLLLMLKIYGRAH